MQPTVIQSACVVSIFAVSSIASPPAPDSTDEKAKAWAAENHVQVLENWVRPCVGVDCLGEHARGLRWRLVVLVWPSADRPEYALEVFERDEGRIEARLVAVVGDNLWDQMLKAKREDPTITLETVVDRIQHHEVIVTGAECKRLIKLGEDYQKLSYPVALEPVHSAGTHYSLWIENPTRSYVRADYTPGASEAIPIVKWIQQVAEVLATECGKMETRIPIGE